MRSLRHLWTASAMGVVFAATSLAQEQAPTRMLGHPAVSADHIAFTYAGDIWLADRDGANARRLTSHPAQEYNPRFSPDGQTLAFSAAYEDNVDVYTISVSGGQPTRLTWHPANDLVMDWSPAGDAVAFASRRETNHGRSGQLYHVSTSGGLPEKQMEARFFQGTYDDDADRLAYIVFGPAYNGLFGGSSGWRGYRGGTTPSVVLFDRTANTTTTIPGERVNDLYPMWRGDTVVFISDRADDKVLNLYSFDPATEALTQLTFETEWDVRSADIHDNTVVYEAGAQLKEFNLDTGETRDLAVSIAPDLPQLRPQWKNAANTLQSVGISPNGKRVLVTARGDVFTIPIEDGSTRNLTDTNSVREYTALWVPDGQSIAYVSDDGQTQTLVIEAQDNLSEPRTFPLGGGFHFLQYWAPEDGPIVFTDNNSRLRTINPDNGDIVDIDQNPRRSGFNVDVSADGRWLAYTRVGENFNSDLFLWDLENGGSTRVTDGMADVGSPAFSPDGAYLFFAASTNAGPRQVGLDMSSQERPYRAGLYAAVLAADGASPLLPGQGDEDAPDDSEDSEEDNGEENATQIDFDGLADRIIALPVSIANYDSLAVAKDGALFYIERVQPGGEVPPPGQSTASENKLMRFDFEDKEASSVMSGVQNFGIAQDGESMIIAKTGNQIVTAKAGKSLDTENVDRSGLRIMIDPRDEWRFIFDEVWRMEREYFYDPNLHGIDWQAIYDKYRPLVDHVGRREDLNTLIVMMIAELHAGHNRAGGGDTHDEQGTNTGLLGADLRRVDGRHQIARIYDGENWNPFLAGPLAQPGLDVDEGDFIIAVNGQQLGETDNIFAALQGLNGEQVTLTVADSANGAGSREIVVEPIGNEFMLRLWHWVEANRAAVDEATDGRVGYVYLPNTAGAGYTLFNRMFFAQVDKEAMIIDERSNGGGQAANYITDVLSRSYLSSWKDRDSILFQTPGGAMYGPKIMLIDQDAGSGGDFLPYSFRTMEIGTLMGTRTWGGLIGIFANPLLIDGGFVSVPNFRFIDVDGEWSVENEGVAPDIVVTLDPVLTNAGRDSQLEAAIVETLRQLEEFTPFVPAEAPPFPTELGE